MNLSKFAASRLIAVELSEKKARLSPVPITIAQSFCFSALSIPERRRQIVSLAKETCMLWLRFLRTYSSIALPTISPTSPAKRFSFMPLSNTPSSFLSRSRGVTGYAKLMTTWVMAGSISEATNDKNSALFWRGGWGFSSKVRIAIFPFLRTQNAFLKTLPPITRTRILSPGVFFKVEIGLGMEGKEEFFCKAACCNSSLTFCAIRLRVDSSIDVL